jgi:tetraprenyl-beta-curcumene synthase
LDYLRGIPLIIKMVKTAFPEINKELDRWKLRAGYANSETLRTQALLSIEKKKFHCQGGSAYALYPSASLHDLIRFIVAFQTISDYLDNLCDRAGIFDDVAFRQLHLSMFDAIDPFGDTHDYYLYYPQKDDGGYLPKLVTECRLQIQKLPSFGLVKDSIRKLISYYIELQVNKHITPSMREEMLTHWAVPLTVQYPEISIWEFCAATGSTLGVFLLVAAAHDPILTSEEVAAVLDTYFPWVSGLHILLDYFIDADEDKLEGDFNFTSCYKNSCECKERLSFFVNQSLMKSTGLRYPGFHRTVIHGLLAMYLSDPKANSKINRQSSRQMLKCGGVQAVLYYRICVLLRGIGKL